jgi:secondary thiamine-phosphate synthase enzyme
MIIFEDLNIRTPKREILIDITSNIDKIVRESNIKEGVCRLFVPHTTAGITINENADPAVVKDIINYLAKLVPQNAGFSHGEGNSDAHIKSSLIGPSLDLIIHNGKLMLGTWQGIVFAEFDGPRQRNLFIQIQGE